MNHDDRSFLPVAYLKTQRGYELDADRVALKMLASAGFNPAAPSDYIRRAQREPASRSTGNAVLPPKAERLAALESAAPAANARRPQDEFKAIQQRVRDLR